jgi:hypothetical protein
MKNSEIKDFGKISQRYVHRSKEWSVLAQAILSAEKNFMILMDYLHADEVEKFHKVVTGNAYCSAFEKVMNHTKIEGTERSSVAFNDAYVPDFVMGRIQSIPMVGLIDSIPTPEEVVDLNEWQVKRGYCYHFARINLNAANDYFKKGKFA